jgi:hypothetical protein
MTKRFIISINSLWKCHVRPATGNTVHTWQQHDSPKTLLLSLAFHFCLSFKDGTEVANYLETPVDQCIILCFCPWFSRKLGGEGVEVKRPYMYMATPVIAELHKG